MINEKELIDNILNRLRGIPTGVFDKNNDMIYVGDIVNIYNLENEYLGSGIIKYDNVNNRHIIFSPFNTKNDGFIEIKYYLSDTNIIIERTAATLYNDYNRFKGYLDKSDTPLRFFKEIYDFHHYTQFYLSDDEYKYIVQYIGLNNEHNKQDIDNKEKLEDDKQISEENINISNIMKRLNGVKLNCKYSNKTNVFNVGDRLKIFYNSNSDPIIGSLKFDIIKNKYYIRLKSYNQNFNNGERNLYLEFFKNKKVLNIPFEQISEIVVASHNHDDYWYCEMLLNDKKYKELYEKFMELYYDEKLYLTEKELLYLEKQLTPVIENITLDVSTNNLSEKGKKLINKLLDDIETLIKNTIHNDCMKIDIKRIK